MFFVSVYLFVGLSICIVGRITQKTEELAHGQIFWKMYALKLSRRFWNLEIAVNKT